ncbi:MAG: tRNA uridine-5-carboxymethylaminomethyl(34) synthesis GTPase MnmE [Bacteroidia bacterium]
MLPDTADTIVALSTAPGTAAIAVIRMSGAEAVVIADKVFRGKSLSEALTHTLHFGVLADGDRQIDEVVISLFRNPSSYTGEDVVEISCHGSEYIQQEILSLLVKKGARLARPGEFTMRAFLHGKMDLAQAEAVADLIATSNRSMHDLAMQQMRGGYSQVLRNLRDKLIEFGALVELELDFSEEDVEFAERGHLLKLTQNIKEVIDGLIHSFTLGNVLRSGVNTVIAGKPNAGKSTLLNALLNEERAIVSAIAGTTRDTIEEVLNIRGIDFRLIDTAGIRDAQDEIEKVGVDRTMEKIGQSAILLYLFDVHTTDKEMLGKDLGGFIKGNYHLILVGNMIDKGLPAEKVVDFSVFGDVLYISAKEKQNIQDLLDRMYYAVVDSDMEQSSVVVSNVRHLESLQKARTALADIIDSIEGKQGGEITALSIRHALNAIGEITGEVTHEDVLGYIFGRFCIGK